MISILTYVVKITVLILQKILIACYLKILLGLGPFFWLFI